MELIYLYIEKFNDFICQQGLPLSNNFEINMQDKKQGTNSLRLVPLLLFDFWCMVNVLL